MNEYKFRAEAQSDVDELLEVAARQEEEITVVKYEPYTEGTPDVVVTIKTTLEIRMLRILMSHVSDGHVMYQTVREPFLYTGNRDYDINLD